MTTRSSTHGYPYGVVTNLRVVDASPLLIMISGNLNSTLRAMAWASCRHHPRRRLPRSAALDRRAGCRGSTVGLVVLTPPASMTSWL